MKKLLPILLAFSLANCSVYMAANLPPKKDLSVLEKGTPRSLILSSLGQPSNSEIESGKKKDYFYFNQGFSSGAKAGRAGAHAALDFFTLGLWEIVGTPIEILASGKRMTIEVYYDKSNKLERLNQYSDDSTKNRIIE